MPSERKPLVDDALEALDRAFDAWHDGDERKARGLARDVDDWFDEAEAAEVDEAHPRAFELIRRIVTDMFAAEWQAAGEHLDTLERMTAGGAGSAERTPRDDKAHR